MSVSVDHENIYKQIAWLEPGSTIDNPTYNLFFLGYNGNTGTEVMFAASDLTGVQLDQSPYGIGSFFHDCVIAGVGNSACPILSNGDTITVPLSQGSVTPTISLGSLDITFTDQGDVATATPEPSLVVVLGAGLFGLLVVRSRPKLFS